MAEGPPGKTHGVAPWKAALFPHSDLSGPQRMLRKSCDACRNAKVKCDGHGKPCHRCLAREIPCQYRWFSQGARHSRDAGASSASPSTPLEPPDTPSDQAVFDFNRPWSPPNPGSGAEFNNGAALANLFASPLMPTNFALNNSTPMPETCLAALLTALQTLETAPSPAGQPGQLYTSMLALNQPVVEICAGVLGRAKLTQETAPGGTQTTALMLLATVLSKLADLYTSAALDCCCSPVPMLMLPSEEREASRRARQAELGPHLARFETVCNDYDQVFSGPVYEGGIARSLVSFLRVHLLTLGKLCDWKTAAGEATDSSVGSPYPFV